jgi:hypothetical protein
MKNVVEKPFTNELRFYVGLESDDICEVDFLIIAKRYLGLL